MKNLCGEMNGSTDQSRSALLARVSDALYVVGGKWPLQILIALGHGHNRFNDLQRSIPDISARVLSHELKKLEVNGFVQRTVLTKARPVIVEYGLTDYSQTLAPVVAILSNWGHTHRQKLREAG